jgi:hypothetical protein
MPVQRQVTELTEELRHVHRRELNAAVHSLIADFDAHRREMDSIAGSSLHIPDYDASSHRQQHFIDRVDGWAERSSELRTRVDAHGRVIRARLRRANEMRGKLLYYPLDRRRLLDELLEEVRIQEGGLAKIDSLSSELRRLAERIGNRCAVGRGAGVGRRRGTGAEHAIQQLPPSRLAEEFRIEMRL